MLSNIIDTIAPVFLVIGGGYPAARRGRFTGRMVERNGAGLCHRFGTRPVCFLLGISSISALSLILHPVIRYAV
ncbi:MAG: hypothetical protein WBM71_03885 [Sedimenticolaceae bacterium]|jgi:predicted permease